MGSPASSDGLGYRYPEHPQPVKGLGLSWLHRGAGYWLRRIVLAATYLFIMLLMAMLAAAGLGAVMSYHPSDGERIAIWIVSAALLAAGLARGAKDAHTANTSHLSPEELRAKRVELQRRNPLRYIRYILRLALIALLPIVAPFLLGYSVTFLAGVSFGRELPSERGARLDLERQRQANAEREAKDVARLRQIRGGHIENA